MPFLSHDRAQSADLVARARSLRLHCRDVLQRAGLLRHRADHLLAISSDLRVRVEAQRTTGRRLASELASVPVVDVGASGELAWYRAQVREMLDAGWSRKELEDVGVTDVLLADLGLEWPC
jgi:hypothetical protein